MKPIQDSGQEAGGVESQVIYELGKALHAPLYTFQELSDREYFDIYEQTNEDPSDVVAVHGAPSEKEDGLRHALMLNHVHCQMENHSRYDPLVLVPQDIQDYIHSMREEVTSFEDLGLNVQDYDLEATDAPVENPEHIVDDYLGIENITSSGDKVDSGVSDYYRRRNVKIGESIIGDRDHSVYGVETDHIGRDSLFMRILERGKTGVQKNAWGHLNMRIG